MKQHPIPQNILDIEFKLFTKFTIREFIYMAVGVGFGGIFLLLFSNGTIPALIAIPTFLLSSGVGLFLGLVPINDQNADIFMGNYFRAITKPTQRVWKSEQLDEKVNWIAQGKGISLTQGTMDRDPEQTSGAGKVIGGSTEGAGENQFIEASTLQKLDQEEEERLQEINSIASETLQSIDNQPNGLPTTISEIDPQQTATISMNNTAPTPAIPDVSPKLPSQEPLEKPVINQPEVMERSEAIAQESPEVVEPTQKASSVSSTNLITISKDTVDTYKTQVEGYAPKPGNISLYITDTGGSPIPQALAMIKDKNNAIVQVYVADPQGLITPEHQLKPGTYSIEIKEDNHQFPAVKYILEGTPLPVANIRSTN